MRTANDKIDIFYIVNTQDEYGTFTKSKILLQSNVNCNFNATDRLFINNENVARVIKTAEVVIFPDDINFVFNEYATKEIVISYGFFNYINYYKVNDIQEHKQGNTAHYFLKCVETV